MVVSRNKLALLGLCTLVALTVATPALAQTEGGGMFTDIQNRYAAAARGWSSAMTSAASFLFWGLAAISLVWTMGLMALRRADLGEFFSEFIRFVVFTGFYFFLLTNGPSIADAIIRSLQQLGSNAASIGPVTPGSIVDIGFDIVSTTVDQSSIWEPVDSAVGIIIACIILVVLALVAVNMLLLLVSAWILAFGGIFFLGFGGSRWTSDMAINYFKTVLGVAASLMAMVLLVGIGKTFVDQYHASMSSVTTIKELAAMMVACVILCRRCCECRVARRGRGDDCGRHGCCGGGNWRRGARGRGCERRWRRKRDKRRVQVGAGKHGKRRRHVLGLGRRFLVRRRVQRER